MIKIVGFIIIAILFTSCNSSDSDETYFDNPELSLNIPADFPELNSYVNLNKPTKYGVELGQKLFNDKQLSADNSVSCASCHIKENAFADHNSQAIGIANARNPSQFGRSETT